MNNDEVVRARLTHFRGIGARLGRVEQRFADRLDRQGNDDLVRDLRRLTVAVAADERDVLPHQFEQRLDLRKRRFAAADHDRQRCRFCADFAARHGSVQIFAAERVDLFRECLGRERRDRAHVDHDLSLGQARGDTVLAEQNVLDVRGVRHHREDDLGFLRDVACMRATDAAGIDQHLRDAAAAMQKDAMTAFDQMTCHRRSHDAEPDETDI